MLLTAVEMTISLGLVGIALLDIPLGTGCAVWTGIGTIGTVLFGVFFFTEPATAARLRRIALILAGITGLKVASPL